MTDDLARDEVFWKLISALDSADVLEHVMIIGTWAEWLYSDYFAAIVGGGDFRVDIGKTHDIDVYFRNYLMEIDGLPISKTTSEMRGSSRDLTSKALSSFGE